MPHNEKGALQSIPAKQPAPFLSLFPFFVWWLIFVQRVCTETKKITEATQVLYFLGPKTTQ
jgi:hypothetical protein